MFWLEAQTQANEKLTFYLLLPPAQWVGGSRRWMNESYRRTGPRWQTERLAGCCWLMSVRMEVPCLQAVLLTIMASSFTQAQPLLPLGNRSLPKSQPPLPLLACTIPSHTRHLALLIQRTAETQTGGGGPGRQHCSATPGCCEWEDSWLMKPELRCFIFLFKSPAEDEMCVFISKGD